MSDLEDGLPDLAGAYGELQNLLIDTASVSDFLCELAVLATDVIVPIASCGITLRRDGQPMTVAASDQLASLVDELQYGRGIGPCLQALHTSEIVVVNDLARDNRWGEYRIHALATGAAGSLSVPLSAGSTHIGALNLYDVVARIHRGGDRTSDVLCSTGDGCPHARHAAG